MGTFYALSETMFLLCLCRNGHPLVGAEDCPVLMHYVRVPSSFEAVKNNLTLLVEVTHRLTWFTVKYSLLISNTGKIC